MSSMRKYYQGRERNITKFGKKLQVVSKTGRKFRVRVTGRKVIIMPTSERRISEEFEQSQHIKMLLEQENRIVDTKADRSESIKKTRELFEKGWENYEP